MSGAANRREPFARNLIFVLMSVSVVCFLAFLSRPSPGEAGAVFPTGAQLKGFSLDHPLLVRSLVLLFNAALLLGAGFCVYFFLVLRKKDLSLAVLPPVCWSVWDVMRGGILFIYIGMVLALLNPFPAGREFAFIAYHFIAGGAAVLYLFGLVNGSGWRALDLIGIRARHLFRPFAAGLLAYVAFIPIFVGLVFVTAAVGRYGGVSLKPQSHFSLFIGPGSAWGYLFIIAFIACIGPVFEEIFFRGFLYRALRRKYGIFPAVVSSALFFSVLHFNIGTLLPIFGLGVLLAYVYERTGSLIAPVIIHVLQNSIAVAAVFVLIWIKNIY